MKNLATLSFGLILIGAVGCADRMRSTVATRLANQTHPVPRIGVAGPGASIAAQEFLRQGYQTIELGPSAVDVIAVAKAQRVPYVATVDAVDTSQAVWNGMFSYSMRVSDTNSGEIVWSSSGSFGQGGMFINAQASNKNAMKRMITDFRKTFPPAQ